MCFGVTILQSYPFYKSVLLVCLAYKLYLDHYQRLSYKKVSNNNDNYYYCFFISRNVISKSF